MKIIETKNAPAPKGMYSQGSVHDGVVYVAGQLGVDPATGETVPGGFAEQLRQALKNVQAILEAGGSDMRHVLRLNVYLSDVSQFPVMNQIFEEAVPAPYPPRTARAVALGPYLVEVDAVGAVVGDKKEKE